MASLLFKRLEDRIRTHRRLYPSTEPPCVHLDSVIDQIDSTRMSRRNYRQFVYCLAVTVGAVIVGLSYKFSSIWPLTIIFLGPPAWLFLLGWAQSYKIRTYALMKRALNDSSESLVWESIKPAMSKNSKWKLVNLLRNAGNNKELLRFPDYLMEGIRHRTIDLSEGTLVVGVNFLFLTVLTSEGPRVIPHGGDVPEALIQYTIIDTSKNNETILGPFYVPETSSLFTIAFVPRDEASA